MPIRHLVLGGARSGKSSFAESVVADLVVRPGQQRIYVATGQAGDGEMAERIAHHRHQRQDVDWTLIEEPVDLASVLGEVTADQVVLVDCLTLWLTNLSSRADRWSEIRALFLESVEQCQADVVFVSNEVGMGVVPLGAETRWFVDEIGRLHQSLATICSHVTLVAAGLPLHLKSPIDAS